MFTIVGVALVLTIAQAPPARVQTPPDALALQVTLDRAGFSPGIIDGRMGSNTERAASAYREQHGADPQPSAEALTTYTITDDDLTGPFAERIPADMVEKSRLPSLAYASPLEALAERYHSSPELIRRLNPEAKFAAGEQIQVPNVEPFIVPAPRLIAPSKKARSETGTTGRSARGRAATPPAPNDLDTKPDVVVTVKKSSSTLTVADADRRVLMSAPVTTGSERDPLPIGEWKVTGIQFSPQFRYNPDLFWDADPAHTKAILKPGPNNPVGVVWIDLSKPHYGIHGTPEPAAIGKTTSHGCVRLTNWDAMRLAGLVKPGTRVVFAE